MQIPWVAKRLWIKEKKERKKGELTHHEESICQFHAYSRSHVGASSVTSPDEVKGFS